jgi:hypothetical protein
MQPELDRDGPKTAIFVEAYSRGVLCLRDHSYLLGAARLKKPQQRQQPCLADAPAAGCRINGNQTYARPVMID